MKLKISMQKHTQPKQIDNRWSQIKMSQPFSARQAFAFCSQGDIGYVHGGYNSDEGILQDMYMAKFNDPDDRRWHLIQQKGHAPGKLRYHTITSYLCYILCIGGQRQHPQDNGQLFCFNLKTQTWQKLQIKPSPSSTTTAKQILQHLTRDSHSSVVHDKNLYIFGGYSLEKGQYCNDMIIINLEKIEQGQVTFRRVLQQQQQQGQGQQQQGQEEVPKPRANFASCALGGQFFVFGGTDSYQFFDDFWKFDFGEQKWKNVTVPEDARRYWPQKRKGAVLVGYPQSQALILFGGMQTITRQQNDLSIYLVAKNQWTKIHSNTNNIYDISPTLKNQPQTSPTLIGYRASKSKQKEQKKQFRIGLVNTSSQQQLSNIPNVSNAPNVPNVPNGRQTKNSFSSSSHHHHNGKAKSQFNSKVCKTQMSFTSPTQSHVVNKTQSNFYDRAASNKKMTVVQEKRYRQFLARKKRLLSEVYAGYKVDKSKRPFSPTSQCLNYTLNQLGQQQQFAESKNPQFHLPKVIFDDKKSEVIGKKPCARDGHAAFAVGKNMYIVGGDRHTVSFNDTHLLRMDKAIESLNYYS